jgi:hypothetical protein
MTSFLNSRILQSVYSIQWDVHKLTDLVLGICNSNNFIKSQNFDVYLQINTLKPSGNYVYQLL